MSGFEMVERIREADLHTPILFASALKSPQDYIEGMNIGADNFIRKPYLPQELDVQIQAILRRIKGMATTKNRTVFHFGNCELNAQTRILLINKEQQESIQLTARETNILQILVEKQGEFVSRGEILTPLWHTQDFYSTRSLDVFISKIRNHLKRDELIEIQTIRGEGFRLVVKTK